MDEYRSNIDLGRIPELLRGAGHVTVTTHAKPDPDAFGSVVALTAALRNIGVKADALLMPPVPAAFASLRGSDIPALHTPSHRFPDGGLIVILDTGAWSQITPIREALTPRLDRTLIIDHHLAGDVPAKHRYIDTTAAACCELVARVLDKLAENPGHKHPFIDPTVADSIFVGIAADTGWFRFSNTTPVTHELAARLQRAGVDHASLYTLIEQTDRPEKLALLTRALGSLRYAAGGRAAVLTLREDDFARTGAMLEETERFVDIPQFVAAVQLVMLVTETPAANRPDAGKPVTRVSFRSKPGPEAVDVNTLARRFGGGGHARAAGAKLDEPIDAAIGKLVAAIETAFAGKG